MKKIRIRKEREREVASVEQIEKIVALQVAAKMEPIERKMLEMRQMMFIIRTIFQDLHSAVGSVDASDDTTRVRVSELVSQMHLLLQNTQYLQSYDLVDPNEEMPGITHTQDISLAQAAVSEAISSFVAQRGTSENQAEEDDILANVSDREWATPSIRHASRQPSSEDSTTLIDVPARPMEPSPSSYSLSDEMGRLLHGLNTQSRRTRSVMHPTITRALEDMTEVPEGEERQSHNIDDDENPTPVV